jgi:hypothetical protein
MERPDRAERLFDEGEALADQERDREALARFRAAWESLPEPRQEQGSAGRILAGIADSCFYLGDWDGCRRAVQEAFRCGGSPANTFLRLRLGQAHYEKGDEPGAAAWLEPLYLAEGDGPFEGEDPKYLNWIRDRLQPASEKRIE